MTQLNFKKLSQRLIIITIIFSAFTINSCRKEGNPTQPAITDPVISQAKAWYESVYIANTKVDNLLAIRGLTSASNKLGTTRAVITQKFDFTQHIKPDWKNADSYMRLKKKVVEIPVDPAGNFSLQLKNGLTGKVNLSKKYSRTSFLLLNDGKGYKAYIMIIMADSAYIGNDLKKLSHNTYRSHDPDFTGAVLYFTPKGQYVSGFTFKNGQLTLPAAASNVAVGNSTQNGKIRAAKLVRDGLDCIDWYADYYVDGVFWYTESLGTTCDGSIPLGNGADDASLSQAGTEVIRDFPAPKNPTFGLNNSNTIIPDGNFDAFLNYVLTTGGSFSDPHPSWEDYQGQRYYGEATDFFDKAGNYVTTYFSPDATGGPFTFDMEYDVGASQNGAPNSTADVIFQTPTGVIDFGSPEEYLGMGAIITTAPGSGSSSIFSDINNPLDAPDDPITNLGIGVTNISADPPLSGTIIAHTVDRRPPPPAVAEDMTYGTNGDISGITSSEINLSDATLFGNMTSLFHACTYFDSGGLGLVGDKMIQQFKSKSGGQFSDPVLNQRVSVSSAFQNFIQQAGNDINTALKNANGNINQVNLQLNYHPVFNGLYNKFHGLQILINDTEYTTIQISNFNILNGNWSATLDIIIYDDFGLDKNDADTYQGYHSGFADWWLLQHTRGYVPFTTIVHLRVIITASF